MDLELLQLFWSFFTANLLAFGGGPACIPLIQEEVVNQHHWMTASEFGEVLAVANALPSPIATKLAGYIGYYVAGIAGSLVAITATVLPTALAMIFLVKFMEMIKTSPYISAITGTVRPIVTVLLATMTMEFLRGSVESIGWGQSIIMIALAYICLEKLKLHPAIAIVISMVYGVIFL